MATKKKTTKKVLSQGGRLVVSIKDEYNIVSTILNLDSYGNSWNHIILAYAECIRRLAKTKFKTIEPKYWGIKKLEVLNLLRSSLNNAAMQQDTKMVHGVIYRVVLWLNNKKK